MNDAEIRLKVDVDGSGAEKSLSKIGKVGASIGKAVLTGAAVAGTALVGLVAKSVQMAGELEQQIGGTEAVFGDFASKVQKQGEEAFNKMGVSANDYMATINKMGALMQGSGIEQEKAMDLSAAAMQRAADVASIMGIDINSAMESIAGAAKGNFTMMDNLGVAMNATAIESYALSKGIKKSYTAMSKAEQIGLAMEMFLEKSAYATGNYAKENKTFAGSMQTMKASFQNFLSGAGDISSVIDSVVAFGEILIQKIIEMAPKIIGGIIQLINAILPQLPTLIQTLLPTVIDGIVMVLSGLMNALPVLIQTLLPSLITGAVGLLGAFIGMLPTMLPTLLKALIDGAIMLILALAEALPEMLPQIVDALLSIIPLIIDNMPLFIEAGGKLIVGLLKGIMNSIPNILSKIPGTIKSILGYYIEMPKKMFNIGIDLIKGLWDGIKSVTTWLYDKIKGFVNGAIDKIKGFFGISSPSKEFAIIGRYNIEGLEEGIMDEEKSLNKTLEATLGSGMSLANDMAINGNMASNFDKQQAIVLNANIEAKVNEGVLFDASSRINYNKSLKPDLEVENMYVLKNTTKDYEFSNIVEYEINEQPNLIAKKQFVNGKRKKITTSYTDVVIEFDLKGLDGSTAKTYLTNLVDGDVYQYWSIVDNQYNTAEFIVTLPPLPLEQCLASDNSIVDEFTVILEKSDDVVVSV